MFPCLDLSILKMEENKNEGDSPIYAGFGYIGIILSQIEKINVASEEAYGNRGLYCLKWLNQLKMLYPLVKSQMSSTDSKKEMDFEEIYVDNNELKIRTIKIKKSEKYIKWFKQIEDMIERNTQSISTPGQNPYKQATYLNDKKILSALSKCQTELLTDANSKHLLMPEGRKDMKDLIKKEWIDRAKKKTF